MAPDMDDARPTKKTKLDFCDTLKIVIGHHEFLVPRDIACAQSTEIESRSEWPLTQYRIGQDPENPFDNEITYDPAAFSIMLQCWYTNEIVLAEHEAAMPSGKKWKLLVDIYLLCNKIGDTKTEELLMQRVKKELTNAPPGFEGIGVVYEKILNNRDKLRRAVAEYLVSKHDTDPRKRFFPAATREEEALHEFLREYCEVREERLREEGRLVVFHGTGQNDE